MNWLRCIRYLVFVSSTENESIFNRKWVSSTAVIVADLSWQFMGRCVNQFSDWRNEISMRNAFVAVHVCGFISRKQRKWRGLFYFSRKSNWQDDTTFSAKAAACKEVKFREKSCLMHVVSFSWNWLKMMYIIVFRVQCLTNAIGESSLMLTWKLWQK